VFFYCSYYYYLLIELEIKVTNVTEGVLAKGDMRDPEIGSAVLAICSILSVGSSFLLGFS
jgi:hypothetical protein